MMILCQLSSAAPYHWDIMYECPDSDWAQWVLPILLGPIRNNVLGLIKMLVYASKGNLNTYLLSLTISSSLHFLSSAGRQASQKWALVLLSTKGGLWMWSIAAAIELKDLR